jgi:hypothetical protein
LARKFDNLMSQIATSSSAWSGRRKLPCVFTEHGAIMAAIQLLMPPPEDPPQEPFGFRRARKN